MKFSKKLSILWLTSILASCGGGGGDNHGAFSPGGIPRVTVSASTSSISQNSFVDINVMVDKGNGSVVADGTIVSAQLTPATLGTLTGAAGGSGTGTTGSSGTGTTGGSVPGNTATNTTSGGRASFRFSSANQNGTAHITFSVNAASTTIVESPPFTAVGTIDINVDGVRSDPRLQLKSTVTTLPVNLNAVDPYRGSPYQAEVDIVWRRENGELVSGTKTVNVSINPITVAAYSTLDDPKTPDDDETKQLMGSGPVDITAGHGTVFINSRRTAGDATFTVTAIDPDNGQTITASQMFNVNSGNAPLPATVNVSAQNTAVYVQGSGGSTSTPVTATVTDGGNQRVPDPVSGNNAFNNVKFEIVNQGNVGGAILTAVSAQGQNQAGISVVARTIQGIAVISFQSGTQQGPIQVRAIADRADNNVDNGIQDPVSGTVSVVVSDGRLFSLVITAPDTGAIQVNPYSPDAVPDDNGVTVPPNPDGSYSMTISVLATDRQGNPILPGTPIRFGLIDSPVSGFPDQGPGFFDITGNDGNPQENGTLFTAPTGKFTTAGGGAGPGDTLLVFGQSVTGNRDLESARTVKNINNATSLNVLTRFNYNDDTGISVDSGSILPYIIGRATEGNITATGVTNQYGVARTTMNYPVARLGKIAAIWAEGNGDTVNGNVEIVTDVELVRFPALAPGRLIASPKPIPGNLTTTVGICLEDYLGSPVQGVFVGFSFADIGVGQGWVDGIASAGTVVHPTGVDGCTTASVKTIGIASADGGDPEEEIGPRVIFSAGPRDFVKISAGGGLILQASPSAFTGGGGPVTLTLLDSAGNPVPNVPISGSCTAEGDATVGIGTQPALTNAQGQTTATIITSDLNQYNSSGSGKCTFVTPAGDPQAIVIVQGVDLCKSRGFSPTAPPECSDDQDTTQVDLTMNVVGAAAPVGSYVVTSSPTSLTCSSASGATATCVVPFDKDAVVILAAKAPPGYVFSATKPTWSGSCAGTGFTATGSTATTTMSAALTCTVTF